MVRTAGDGRLRRHKIESGKDVITLAIPSPPVALDLGDLVPSSGFWGTYHIIKIWGVKGYIFRLYVTLTTMYISGFSFLYISFTLIAS